MEQKKNNVKPSAKPNENQKNNNDKTNKGNSSKSNDDDNWGDDPEKKIEIGDDPDGTQKKIPTMKN